MNLQVQPDAASCFITAVSMVIDRPVKEVIAAVDKPYKDIVHIGAPGSMKYRGHHAQDFNEYLQSIGWCLVLNYAKWPVQHVHSIPKKCLLCGGTGKFKGRWEESNLLLANNVGVLQYGNHFCAWDGEKIYNPKGEIQEFHTTKLLGFHPMYQIRRDENVPDRPTGHRQDL